MKNIADAVRAISNESSTTGKQVLLKHYGTLPGFKDVIKFIYNPYCKTGISDAKLERVLEVDPPSTGFGEVEWQTAIDYFSKHQTGTNNDLAVARSFVFYTYRKYGAAAAELAKAIVTQNLKIGVSVASLNKAYGKDFIPKTGCMLGTPYGDVNPASIAWPCIVTEKLDGVRRILVKENGVCRLYSRSGHVDTGLVEIERDARYLPDNYVYDGELLAAGTFKDSIAQRQATNSIAAGSGNKTGLIFNVFDMVPVADFYAGKSKAPALERKIRLAATFRDDTLSIIDEDWIRRTCAFGIYEAMPNIKSVPILGLANSIDAVTPMAETIWNAGGEGVMLNTASGLYEIKRSKQLLKIKHTEEKILQVVDLIEGTGKYEDAMGALVVIYKGNYVGVGSGFTDDQRQAIWDNPEAYVGRYVEVETFGESINAQGFVSLNCPIFKRFVGEVE